MALVKCRECGKEISDTAGTCPSCGVSSPAGACTLTFSRAQFVGGGNKIDVYVDGKPYGSLRAKGRFSVPVTAGSHHVELRSSTKKSVSTVNVTRGDTELHVSISVMGTPRIQ